MSQKKAYEAVTRIESTLQQIEDAVTRVFRAHDYQITFDGHLEPAPAKPRGEQ